jgi:prepilin-type N-terminal cleavage/methylation domain-containing protein
MQKLKIMSMPNEIKNINDTAKGFTLIEVLVSISIFAMVMVIATGSIFSIVNANKKTHSIKSVMTNLNFALESMARDIRVGSKYLCDNTGDCETGGDVFKYKANRDVDLDGSYSLDVSNTYDFVEYYQSGSSIMKKIYGSGGEVDYAVTAEEVVIESLKFYVTGSAEEDELQPKLTITIKGHSGSGQTRSDFNIETTLSQRVIDS